MRTGPVTPLHIWASPPRAPAGLHLARLLHHFDNHFSGLRRIAHFPQECDPSSLHAILSFQAQMESEAVDRGQLCFLCLNASKPLGQQDERIFAEGIATEETTAACAFDTLAVCATSANGTASGSTRKPPDGWYRSRKSTFAEFGPSPPLTRRKLIWRPFAVEISKLLSACSLVRALTNTSSGSYSECSTWNNAGSPTTTEFTGSGTRIAVTKCAASSIEVILLSAVGLVRTCGTMVVCCAPAVTVNTVSESQLKNKAFLIHHLSFSLCRANWLGALSNRLVRYRCATRLTYP